MESLRRKAHERYSALTRRVEAEATAAFGFYEGAKREYAAAAAEAAAAAHAAVTAAASMERAARQLLEAGSPGLVAAAEVLTVPGATPPDLKKEGAAADAWGTEHAGGTDHAWGTEHRVDPSATHMVRGIALYVWAELAAAAGASLSGATALRYAQVLASPIGSRGTEWKADLGHPRGVKRANTAAVACLAGSGGGGEASLPVGVKRARGGQESVLSAERFRALRVKLAAVCGRVNVFYDAVDAAELPGYADVVREPMCVRKLQQEFEGGGCSGVQRFAERARLIPANALSYNARGTHPENYFVRFLAVRCVCFDFV